MTHETKTRRQFYKVWFSNGTVKSPATESTAKLVIDNERLPYFGTSIAEYSRLFPVSEAGKMKRLLRTGTYNSFIEAFHDRSREQDLCLLPSDQFYIYDETGEITGTR
jgi:hypothetical protein